MMAVVPRKQKVSPVFKTNNRYSEMKNQKGQLTHFNTITGVLKKLYIN
jgi:hypothetical protein